QHEEKKDNTDLGTDVDKILGKLQRKQPAIAESQPAHQVKRDGGKTEPVGQTCQDCQADNGRAQLNEDPGHFGRSGSDGRGGNGATAQGVLLSPEATQPRFVPASNSTTSSTVDACHERTDVLVGPLTGSQSRGVAGIVRNVLCFGLAEPGI